MKKNKLRIVGILSGTSADGVDVAVCDIYSKLKTSKTPNSKFPTDYHYESKVVCFSTIPFKKEEKEEILRVIQKGITIRDVCRLNFSLGEIFGNAILKCLKENKIDLNTIDLIGSHGQTVWHEVSIGGKNCFSTLQIGEASVISKITKKIVVSDFRTSDVALFGQGAPLTSVQDLLMSNIEKGKWKAIQNIGGQGNVSLVSSEGKIISFDTGPGNVLIDSACRILFKVDFDESGKIAAKGKVNNILLEEIMSLEYFSKEPPKTTGRELFSEKFVKELIEKYPDINKYDIISTLTQVTVDSIVLSYKNFCPKFEDLTQIEINGGGSKNKEILNRIKQKLPKVKIVLNSETKRDSKEAELFALLAYLNIKGRYSNIPNVTGASDYCVLGKVTNMWGE